MAIKTFRTLIDNTAYTLIKGGCTVIGVTENKVGQIRVVVTDVGDAVPDVGEVNYIEFEDDYQRSLSSGDVYMMSPSGPAWIMGEAE